MVWAFFRFDKQLVECLGLSRFSASPKMVGSDNYSAVHVNDDIVAVRIVAGLDVAALINCDRGQEVK